MTNKKKKVIKIILFSLGAMAFMAIASYVLWWYGFFLPRWIQWEKREGTLGEVSVTLKGRKVTVRDPAQGGKTVWETQGDWFVQDLIIKDVDRDGQDEMILLTWKHGSYGDHMPFWVEKNDRDLKQHIFIYKFDEKKDTKIRAIWMSSQITYDITSISSGKGSFLNVTDRTGNTRVWTWQDFGLKLVR